MAYHIEVYDRYIYVRFSRETLFTIDLIREVLREQRKNNEHKVLNDIWDARGCIPDADLDSRSIDQVVAFIQTLHQPGRYHQKSALVVDSELAFGMSRIYQALSEALPYRTEIFKDVESARKWILAAESE